MPRRSLDWFNQAKGDLKAAKDLRSTGNYAWCCFASHQAAEKGLKAMLEHFASPAHGHDLLGLMKGVGEVVSVPERIRDACRILNRYYIPTRYPNAFSSGAPIDMFDERDAD